MARFLFCTQGTPPHLNPRNAWEILIQFRRVTVVTVPSLYYPSGCRCEVWYLGVPSNSTQPYFYWKNWKCFKLYS